MLETARSTKGIDPKMERKVVEMTLKKYFPELYEVESGSKKEQEAKKKIDELEKEAFSVINMSTQAQ